MEMLIVSCYTLEVCLVVWMQYKLVHENVSITPYLHSFPTTFAYISSGWGPNFVVLPLNWEFNSNLSMKFNNSYFFGMIIVF
jgi:hypothetical protein